MPTTTTPLVVLWSRKAFVDPSVQVHARTCPHVDRRLADPEWAAAPFEDEAGARPFAGWTARRLGVAVSWMDCSL